MNIGTNLRALRLAKNFTQDAVAESIGVSTKTYRNMENGKAKIAVDALPKAAGALGVSVDELMKHEGMTLHNNFRNQQGHNIVFGQALTKSEREYFEELLRTRDTLIKDKDNLITQQQSQIQRLLEKIDSLLTTPEAA